MVPQKFIHLPLARSNQDSDTGDEDVSSSYCQQFPHCNHISITEPTDGSGKASVKTMGWNENWGRMGLERKLGGWNENWGVGSPSTSGG